MEQPNDDTLVEVDGQMIRVTYFRGVLRLALQTAEAPKMYRVRVSDGELVVVRTA